MPSKKDEAPELPANIPLTYRDFPGEVEVSEPVQVTTVHIAQVDADELAAETKRSAKPAGKETK